MPTALYSHGSCVVNGKIYVMGGITTEDRINMSGSDRVEMYDPVTDTWSEKKAMPTPRESLAISAVNGKIYAIGGAPGIFKTELSIVEEYDPQTDTWNTSKARMPTARIGLSTSVVDGKIYAIGGRKRSTNTALADVEEYDPKTNTWLKKAPLKHSRARLSTCVIAGKIYAFGGAGSKAVEVYDPVTDVWTSKADMPNSFYGYSVCALHDMIYIFGGTHFFIGEPPISDSWEYNPNTDIWKSLSRMPLARFSGQASEVDGKIYLTGGSSKFWPHKPTSSVFEYDSRNDPYLSQKPSDFSNKQDLKADRFSSLESRKDFRITVTSLVPEKGQIPGNTSCMVQDDNGFLWFVTKYGLLRYDGYTIKAYRHNPDNPGSISDSYIKAIAKSASGDLWIGTKNGLNRLELEMDKITVYHSEEGNPNSLGHNWIHSVYEDRSGILWIGTQDGLDQLNPEKGSFTHFKNLVNIGIFAIQEDSSGIMWFGGADGLFQYDRKTEQSTHYLPEPQSYGDPNSNFIRSLYIDKENVLWVGTNSGLLHLKQNSSGSISFIRDTPKNNNLYNYPENAVWSIDEDRQGIIWFSTESGLYRYDRHADEKPMPVDCQLDQTPGRNRIVFYDVLEDNTGILWMSTSRGVLKTDKRSMMISCYKPDPDNANSLSNGSITSVLEDDNGILWIGTFDGLNRFDRKKNEWTRFYSEAGNANSLSFNYILSLAKDNSGYLWIGTYNGGLSRLDPQNMEWQRYQKYGQPGHLSFWWVQSLYTDRENTLWAGTWLGILNRYNRHTDTFTWFKNKPGKDNTLSKSENIFCMLEDKSGMLWIGTEEGGLNRFDRSQNLFKHYRNEPGNPKSLSHNSVRVLYEDRNSMLWIGTQDGLNKLDLSASDSNDNQGQSFVRYMPGKWINGILEDDAGNLWLSVAGLGKELIRFNPQTENFTDFGNLLGNKDGKLLYKSERTGEFFVTGDGLRVFHPGKITKNQSVPNVVLTDFQIFNKSVPVADQTRNEIDVSGDEYYQLNKSITSTKKITLSYKESFFAFEFAALHFADPSKNQYAYKMEGFDRDWNYIGTRRYVSFSNLPAGDYTFRVKASNSDGVWNEEGASLKIIILPPWWGTRWAYSFYILFTLSLLYGSWRFRIKRLKMKQQLEMEHFETEKLREVDQLKSRFFANISHEFRTPLALILGPVGKLLSRINNSETNEELNIVQRNALRLRQLIDQLLDLSKLETGNMQLKTRPLDIVQKIKEWAASFASLAESRNITFKLGFPRYSVMIYFDQQKMEKIIYNLLGNAFKYTPQGGVVEVSVENKPTPLSPPRRGINSSPSREGLGVGKGASNHLKISVSNTGPGIAREHLDKIFDRFYSTNESLSGEQSSSGIGLALVKELVELHHGEITVESNPGKESTFTVTLPLGRDHLKDEEIGDAVKDAGETEKVDFPSDTSDSDVGASGGNGVPGKSGKSIVLIIEDNRDMRHFISGCLAPCYEIEEARNGKAGINIALKIVPDLIISDVMMPEMDGFELCKNIKADERTSHIPVILMTARAAQEDKVAGLETGADAYIIKPFDQRELQIRVKKLIEQRLKLRDHFQREIYFQNNHPPPKSRDEKFIQKAVAVVQEHMTNPDFGVQDLVNALDMSRVQLHRKLHALTGFSASIFIRTNRLKRAAELLKKNSSSVAEIAYDVGFNNLSYFHRCFLKQFGKTPAQYNHHPE